MPNLTNKLKRAYYYAAPADFNTPDDALPDAPPEDDDDLDLPDLPPEDGETPPADPPAPADAPELTDEQLAQLLEKRGLRIAAAQPERSQAPPAPSVPTGDARADAHRKRLEQIAYEPDFIKQEEMRLEYATELARQQVVGYDQGKTAATTEAIKLAREIAGDSPEALEWATKKLSRYNAQQIAAIRESDDDLDTLRTGVEGIRIRHQEPRRDAPRASSTRTINKPVMDPEVEQEARRMSAGMRIPLANARQILYEAKRENGRLF